MTDHHTKKAISSTDLKEDIITRLSFALLKGADYWQEGPYES